MNQAEKWSAMEASGRTYSVRKVPKWRIAQTDLQAYLETMDNDWEDLTTPQ